MNEKQYEFFLWTYNEENSRYKELLNRGKIFISIITFYLGLVLFKSIDLISKEKLIDELQNGPIYHNFFIASIIVFTVALFLNILALGIFSYQYPANPIELLEKLDTENQSEEVFFKSRSVDFSVAFEHNKNKNDKRATLLLLTSIFIFMGIILHLLFLLSNFH